MRIQLILLLLGLVVITMNGQSCKEKQNWLQQNAQTIQSISPENVVYADLLFLKEVLKNKRIVLLGEQTHIDGSTEEAQVRLIKFLHEEMGYNTVLYEMGFTEVDRAYRDIVLQRDSAAGVFCWLTEFFGWKITKEDKYLADFIQSSLDTDTPVKLGGIDIDEGSIYMNNFYKELEELFVELDETFLDSNTENAFIAFTRKGKMRRISAGEEYENEYKKKMSSLNLDSLKHFSKVLIDRLEVLKKLDISNSQRERLSFFQQGIRSRLGRMDWELNRPSELDEGQFTFSWTKIRDEYMAENLLWYLRNHPEEKIIVSASSFHTSRNLDKLKSIPEDLGDAVPMGQMIWNEYASELYSIAFIRYEGAIGERNDPLDASYKKIKKAKKKSMEGRLHSLNVDYAFLDFTRLENDGLWLKGEEIMHPVFMNPIKTDWTKIYDGVFFINEMKPNTKVGFRDRVRKPQPYKTPEEWFEG